MLVKGGGGCHCVPNTPGSPPKTQRTSYLHHLHRQCHLQPQHPHLHGQHVVVAGGTPWPMGDAPCEGSRLSDPPEPGRGPPTPSGGLLRPAATHPHATGASGCCRAGLDPILSAATASCRPPAPLPVFSPWHSSAGWGHTHMGTIGDGPLVTPPHLHPPPHAGKGTQESWSQLPPLRQGNRLLPCDHPPPPPSVPPNPPQPPSSSDHPLPPLRLALPLPSSSLTPPDLPFPP